DLRIRESRNAQHVDDAQRTRRLRAHEHREREGENGRSDETAAGTSHRRNLRSAWKRRDAETILPRYEGRGVPLARLRVVEPTQTEKIGYLGSFLYTACVKS